MNARILGLIVMIALVIVGMWMWLGRGESVEPTGPGRPAAVDERSEPLNQALVAESSSVDKARISAATPAPATELPVSATSALLKVLVVGKSTRAPMAGIDVYATLDDGHTGYRLEKNGTARGKPFESLLTDAAGRVEIEVPPDIESAVHANGGEKDAGWDQTLVPALKIGAEREVVLVLPTTNDLPFWMKIVDEETRAPLPSVPVKVEARNPDTRPLASDAAGLLLYEARTWASATLRVEPEGRSTTYVMPEPGHERADTAFVVSIPLAATLRVRVVDGTGSPLPHARIELSTPGYNLCLSKQTMLRINAPDLEWREETDVSGIATIARLPPRVPIQASTNWPRKWTSPEHLTFQPGEAREVEWKLTNGCELHGLVLDQKGAPVADREIWLRKAEQKRRAYFQSYSKEKTSSEKTDAEGRFLFHAVSPGLWSVGPSGRDQRAEVQPDDVAPLAEIVEIHDDRTEMEVILRVDRGLLLRGRVLDSTGQPSKSCYVTAYELELKLLASANVNDPNGGFTIGPLMDGRYILSARSIGGDAPSEPVTSRAGEEGVVLHLRAGAALAGRVVAEDGRGIVAQVSVVSADAAATGGHHIGADKEGLFSISGLTPGVFNLAATTSSGQVGFAERIELGAGASVKDILIKVVPGGHVRVRHEGPDAYANIFVFQRGISVEGDGIERGASREFVAPAGTVLVRAEYYEGERRTAERTVEVKAGETVEVAFEKGAH